MFAFTENQ